ncbi:hypothetical protein FOMA001_g7240 [Fusarium oxysporum f. sp. matthiolae]|nr:hypothetical protein FOMA001_g7240 [Fusarium oxysporum f. sp. matthiolae]
MATTVDQLLFAELPDVPWRDGQEKQLQAVTMLQSYEYDDNADNVPLPIRNRIHDSLKIDNRLHLFEGEQGLLYDINPARTKAAVLFMKGAKEVLVTVPINLLRLGSMFKLLEQKTFENISCPPSSPSNFQIASADNVFDATLQSFFALLSSPEQLPTVRNLDIYGDSSPEMLNNLADNVRSIQNALLPDVRTAIESGSFSLRDLIDLPNVDIESNFPPAQSCCIYMRLYIDPQDQPGSFANNTQADINGNVGVYIGQTRHISRRMAQHDSSIVPGSPSVHYRRALQSAPENRFAIPLIVWNDPHTPSATRNMAEQFMILLFDSYHVSMHFGRSTHSRAICDQAKFLSFLFSQISSTTGWPHIRPHGLNIASPLFHNKSFSGFTCVAQSPGNPNTRKFTTYRIPRTASYTSNFRQCRLVLYLYEYGESGRRQRVMAFDVNSEVFGAQKPSRVYLVFEIMDDKKPHPRPWHGMPSVGPFKNFEQASSIGVRCEWYDAPTHCWYTVPIQRKSVHREETMKRILQEGDVEHFLSPYKSAMMMIQFLRGIEYTGPLHGHAKIVTAGSLIIKVLVTDHIQQTYHFIDQLPRLCPAPTLSDWEENFNLMVKEFASENTRVGLSAQPQVTDDSMIHNSADLIKALMGKASLHPCDTCMILKVGHAELICEPDPSDPRGCCKVCALFNRPCTFTPRSELSILVGNRKPWPDVHMPFSMYPDGPFRTLFYHRAIHPDVVGQAQAVPTPIEERLAYGFQEEFEEEEEEEEPIDIEGLEINEE